MPLEKISDYRDMECPGLILRIYPTGRKRFLVDYRVKHPAGSKRGTLDLGDPNFIKLTDARKKANVTRATAFAGESPKPIRSNSSGEITVSKMINRVLNDYVKVKLKPRTVSDYEYYTNWIKSLKPEFSHHRFVL